MNTTTITTRHLIKLNWYINTLPDRHNALNKPSAYWHDITRLRCNQPVHYHTLRVYLTKRYVSFLLFPKLLCFYGVTNVFLYYWLDTSLIVCLWLCCSLCNRFSAKKEQSSISTANVFSLKSCEAFSLIPWLSLLSPFGAGIKI